MIEIATESKWIETRYPIKGASGGLLPVDESFVRGVVTSREKLTNSGITVGQEIANNCNYFFNLQEGQILADLGCGPGLISTHLTPKLGDTGWTYCLDASKEMLDKASGSLFGKRATLFHGDIHVVDKIIPEKVDAVILSGNVHLISNREMAFKAIKNILKPDGKLVVVCHAYFHGNQSNSNFFASSVDALRETRKDIKVDGLRLPMLSEAELNSIVKTIKKTGLSINSYEPDSQAPDINAVFGFPPERTIIHRLKVTNPNFPESAARSVATGILSDVYQGRQSQIYLLCTNRNTFVSKPK